MTAEQEVRAELVHQANHRIEREILAGLGIPAALLVVDEGLVNRKLAELAERRHRGR